MAKFTAKFMKSPVPIIVSEDECDLEIGEAIVFEWDGREYRGVCSGVNINPNKSVYVTTGIGLQSVVIPIGRVWRAWDVKDAWYAGQLAAEKPVVKAKRKSKDEG